MPPLRLLLAVCAVALCLLGAGCVRHEGRSRGLSGTSMLPDNGTSPYQSEAQTLRYWPP